MIILGENTFFNNGYKENANNLIIGAPGTGKSRSFVIPNLCEADNESILLLDPKGELYNITHQMMANKGYNIEVLDFDQPEKSPSYYNPLAFIKTQDDVIKFSKIMISDKSRTIADPFWCHSSLILCNALTSYLVSYRPERQQVLSSIARLLSVASPSDSDYDNKTKLDKIFEEIKDPNPWCRSQYTLVRTSASRTMRSIVVSLISEFAGLLTPEITALTSKNTIDMKKVCEQKTIIYVKCSDTDRSKDKLVSLFFTQFIQQAYLLADRSPTRSLPRPLHVILDDMGANLTIPDLDCSIATSRGRDISFSLILQSFGQLKKNYADYTSIISSCNNLVFLGSNDIETCKDICTRLNRPLSEVLYKEKGTIFIFQQGATKPVTTKVYNLKQHPRYNELSAPYTVPTNRNACSSKFYEVEKDAI